MRRWPTTNRETCDGAVRRPAILGFKKRLADLAVAKLAPITTEMRRLLADPAEIDQILKAGAEKAQAICEPIVAEVRKIVGFAD